MANMEEYFFQCPHCWSQVSVIVDTSVKKQEYIEDCEVCCNPIEFKIYCEDFEVTSFEANSIEQ
jgi:transcription elongation factor Elf1